MFLKCFLCTNSICHSSHYDGCNQSNRSIHVGSWCSLHFLLLYILVLPNQTFLNITNFIKKIVIPVTYNTKQILAVYLFCVENNYNRIDFRR